VTESTISFAGIWSVIIGVGVFLYVLLDGFDPGSAFCMASHLVLRTAMS